MRLIKYSLIVFIMIISCACSKNFLDVPDTAVTIRQAYVTDLAATADALDGLHIMLAQNFYYGYNQVYPDLVADNIKPVTATSADLGPHYNWTQFAVTGATRTKNMNAAWLDGYQIISYCNFVVAKAEEYRNQNVAKADDIKAQALTLRAFVHFMLVNLFAQSYGFTADASHPGIPYVTNYDWTEPATRRNTVAEVYSNVINDLITALPLFTTGKINKLYMNGNAAKAILARVYLFKGDFQSAKNLARELSTSVPIMPAGAGGYPSKLFTLNETEAFFQIVPSAQSVSLPSPTGAYQGSHFTYFQGTYFGRIKLFIATTDIATVLTQNPSDLRKAWVASNGDIVKYPSDVVSGFSSTGKYGAYYPTLIRSSEMYLTASEAYAQLKNEDSARYYLNQIRTRANIPAVAASMVGVPLLDSIYLERRRELAFEGLRMFDLQRWKKGVNRQDAWSPSVKSLPYPSNKAIAPLPPNDVQMLGLSQNLDY